MRQYNIVIVRTQYVWDAGFQGLRPIVFVPGEKFLRKYLEVSQIISIFAALKISVRYNEAAAMRLFLYPPYS